MRRDTVLINEILSHLDELAKAPVLLVASDFDGTLAPIAANPSDAIAERATLVALRALSQLPQTHVAVISGRALGDLASRVRDVEELHLVGSHGSEFEAGFSPPLEAGAVELLRQLKQGVAAVASECPGYRYCWLRDGAMVANSLLRLGSPGTSIQFLDWVLGVVDQCEPASFVNPVYTVTGGHLGPEGEIMDLAGYRGSRPVRIGNQASQQIQLDVFGPIADLIARLADRGEPLSSEHWHLLDTMVHAIGNRWREPDHGIWEERRARQHHEHSKVMCWQTVDRALLVADYLGRRRLDWIALRSEIANDILVNGWNPKIDSFSAAYGNNDADASVLVVGLSGLVRRDDPRFIKTIGYVERMLRTGPIVYRYHFDDGLPGVEGGFLLCTAWLIQALVMVGRVDDAPALFDDYVSLAGPTGLFAEQYDPKTHTSLGNFPQAYSHVGLIDSALTLEALHR